MSTHPLSLLASCTSNAGGASYGHPHSGMPSFRVIFGCLPPSKTAPRTDDHTLNGGPKRTLPEAKHERRSDTHPHGATPQNQHTLQISIAQHWDRMGQFYASRWMIVHDHETDRTINHNRPKYLPRVYNKSVDRPFRSLRISRFTR